MSALVAAKGPSLRVSGEGPFSGRRASLWAVLKLGYPMRRKKRAVVAFETWARSDRIRRRIQHQGVAVSEQEVREAALALRHVVIGAKDALGQGQGVGRGQHDWQIFKNDTFRIIVMAPLEAIRNVSKSRDWTCCKRPCGRSQALVYNPGWQSDAG